MLPGEAASEAETYFDAENKTNCPLEKCANWHCEEEMCKRIHSQWRFQAKAFNSKLQINLQIAALLDASGCETCHLILPALIPRGGVTRFHCSVCNNCRRVTWTLPGFVLGFYFIYLFCFGLFVLFYFIFYIWRDPAVFLCLAHSGKKKKLIKWELN